MDKQIVPAILTQDLADFKDKIKAVDGAVEWIHVDVADGQFVNSYTLDIEYLPTIPHQSKIEVHLMVKDVTRYVQKCKDAGVNRVIFHYEATQHHSDILQKIDELGMEKGLAIKLDTPVEVVKDFLHRLNVVLIFSAPKLGLSGQSFAPAALEKIKELRKISPSMHIVVDGGIEEDNIGEISRAGATSFAISSSIFYYKDRKNAIAMFQRKLK